jgi:hypothetical protein
MLPRFALLGCVEFEPARWLVDDGEKAGAVVFG